MKRIGYVFVLVLICSSVGAGLPPDVPPDKTFISSGEILTGEEWNRVSVYGDDTVVDMFGGLVYGLRTYDASTFNLSGSDGYRLPDITAYDTSLINISHGNSVLATVWGNATVNVYEGLQDGFFNGYDYGTINVFGGNISNIALDGFSVLNLFEVDLSAPLNINDFSIVNVYGYDLAKTNTGGQRGYGQITGFWQSGTPFTIDLSAGSYDHINLIPEPGSAVLLMVGIGGFLRRRRLV